MAQTLHVSQRHRCSIPFVQQPARFQADPCWNKVSSPQHTPWNRSRKACASHSGRHFPQDGSRGPTDKPRPPPEHHWSGQRAHDEDPKLRICSDHAHCRSIGLARADPTNARTNESLYRLDHARTRIILRPGSGGRTRRAQRHLPRQAPQGPARIRPILNQPPPSSHPVCHDWSQALKSAGSSVPFRFASAARSPALYAMIHAVKSAVVSTPSPFVSAGQSDPP